MKIVSFNTRDVKRERELYIYMERKKNHQAKKEI